MKNETKNTKMSIIFGVIFGIILTILLGLYAKFGGEDNIILVGLCVGLITILNTFQRKYVEEEEIRANIEDVKDTLLYTGILIYTINRFNLNDSWNLFSNLTLYILIYYIIFFVLAKFKNK